LDNHTYFLAWDDGDTKDTHKSAQHIAIPLPLLLQHTLSQQSSSPDEEHCDNSTGDTNSQEHDELHLQLTREKEKCQQLKQQVKQEKKAQRQTLWQMRKDVIRENMIQQNMQQSIRQQLDRVQVLTKKACHQLRQEKEQAHTNQQERDALQTKLAQEREAWQLDKQHLQQHMMNLQIQLLAKTGEGWREEIGEGMQKRHEPKEGEGIGGSTLSASANLTSSHDCHDWLSNFVNRDLPCDPER